MGRPTLVAAAPSGSSPDLKWKFQKDDHLTLCVAFHLATEFIYPIVATTADSFADSRISISRRSLWSRDSFSRNFLGFHHLCSSLRTLSSRLPQFIKLCAPDGFSSPDFQSPSIALQKLVVRAATATPHSWYQIFS